MTTLRAEEALFTSMVASVPYMDSEDRQELIENWQHIAGNETQANEEKYDRVSFADFQNEIKRGL